MFVMRAVPREWDGQARSADDAGNIAFLHDKQIFAVDPRFRSRRGP
jgi:hypothetical protein